MISSLLLSPLSYQLPSLPRATASRSALAMSASDRRAFLQTSAAAAIALATPFAASAKAKNSVLFTNVKDGETVPSKFTYKFDVTGYELSPAKEGLKEGTGHHHMIIDGPTAFVTPGEVIPMDDTHKHYGKAQSEGELELEPGKHTIQLQLSLIHI